MSSARFWSTETTSAFTGDMLHFSSLLASIVIKYVRVVLLGFVDRTCIYIYFFVGTLQNELAVLEFIHTLVETLDKYFENVVWSCCLFCQIVWLHSQPLRVWLGLLYDGCAV